MTVSERSKTFQKVWRGFFCFVLRNQNDEWLVSLIFMCISSLYNKIFFLLLFFLFERLKKLVIQKKKERKTKMKRILHFKCKIFYISFVMILYKLAPLIYHFERLKKGVKKLF